MIATARLITTDELVARLGTHDEPFLLDVRDPNEHVEWRIAGARNIPLAELPVRMDEVPADREVVVYCASGRRSAAAGRLLVDAGRLARDLEGGMRAWSGTYDTAELRAGGATIVQVRRRAKGCLSYVVGAGDEAFVVDPSLEADRYVDIARERGWRVTRVFDTHLHADHLSGARMLAAHTGATLHLDPHDHVDFACEGIDDAFTLGGSVDVTVAPVHTPGHTRGSTMLVVDGAVALTGDTLFVDGVGRPDLAARVVEFARALYHSLHGRVLTLPDTTIVLPSHHGEDVVPRSGRVVAATIGELRTTLPELALDEDVFVEWCASRTTPTPPGFGEIIAANARSDVDLAALAPLESGPNRCSA
jgi:glyoxylase-like metal-dependent hydrolase (beta-lactamase superfamily II)